MISFLDVMRDPRSWEYGVNINAVMENYLILKEKGLMEKMYFTRYPKRPEVFMLVFSRQSFPDTLIENIDKLGMKSVNNIWFTEYLEEDRKKLIALGVLESKPFEEGKAGVAYMHNGAEYYINVIL